MAESFERKKDYVFEEECDFMVFKVTPHQSTFVRQTLYEFAYVCICGHDNHTNSTYFNYSSDRKIYPEQLSCCHFNTLEELMIKYLEIKSDDIHNGQHYTIYIREHGKLIARPFLQIKEALPDYIKYLQDKKTALEIKVHDLELKNEQLNLALYYHPDNEGAKEAQQHFNELVHTNNN